jgi:hypothetical protein
VLKREAGENPELPRSGKQERTPEQALSRLKAGMGSRASRKAILIIARL